MIEKYLPIGTVVMLKNAKKRVMIIGYVCLSDEKQDKVYDYCGCPYPEGFISSNINLLFDHDQIDHIYYLGYNDQEFSDYQVVLKNFVADLEKKQQNKTENTQKKTELINQNQVNPNQVNPNQINPNPNQVNPNQQN